MKLAELAALTREGSPLYFFWLSDVTVILNCLCLFLSVSKEYLHHRLVDFLRLWKGLVERDII